LFGIKSKNSAFYNQNSYFFRFPRNGFRERDHSRRSDLRGDEGLHDGHVGGVFLRQGAHAQKRRPAADGHGGHRGGGSGAAATGGDAAATGAAAG